jgi:hypothetical protein
MSSLKVIWFPQSSHSELSIENKIHYFIGKRDRYSHQRNLSYSIANCDKTPIVVFSFNADKTCFEVYKEIEDHPPSLWNTCMGSVADIVKRVSSLSIPSFIRQSPELSALYLMTRHFTKGDVSFETYGVSKMEAAKTAMIGGGVQCGAAIVSSLFIFSLIVKLSSEGQLESNINLGQRV